MIKKATAIPQHPFVTRSFPDGSRFAVSDEIAFATCDGIVIAFHTRIRLRNRLVGEYEVPTVRAEIRDGKLLLEGCVDPHSLPPSNEVSLAKLVDGQHGWFDHVPQSMIHAAEDAEGSLAAQFALSAEAGRV